MSSTPNGLLPNPPKPTPLTSSTSSSLKLQNSLSGGYGSTKIRNPIASLCSGVTYTLTYESQITIDSGGTGLGCRLEIVLDDLQLLVLDGLDRDTSYGTTSTTFIYSGNAKPQGLTFRFICYAPKGLFIVDNVGLVGSG